MAQLTVHTYTTDFGNDILGGRNIRSGDVLSFDILDGFRREWDKTLHPIKAVHLVSCAQPTPERVILSGSGLNLRYQLEPWN